MIQINRVKGHISYAERYLAKADAKLEKKVLAHKRAVQYYENELKSYKVQYARLTGN